LAPLLSGAALWQAQDKCCELSVCELRHKRGKFIFGESYAPSDGFLKFAEYSLDLEIVIVFQELSFSSHKFAKLLIQVLSSWCFGSLIDTGV